MNTPIRMGFGDQIDLAMVDIDIQAGLAMAQIQTDLITWYRAAEAAYLQRQTP